MILVLGDAFLDSYHVGTVRGMSAEAPIPIVDVTTTKIFEGGALNVFNNLQALGVKATFKDFAPWDRLESYPIKNRLITPDNLQLARWDTNDFCYPYPPNPAIAPDKYEAIVVSDYAKGSITPEVIEYLASLPIPLFVDTKRDPQPWLLHPNVVLFPNLTEYHRYESSYNWFPKVVLKQSAQGLAWMEYGKVILSSPSMVGKVVCVNGAGDTVLAAFTKATLLGWSIPTSLKFANLAARIVVEKPFTATASMVEIYPPPF